MNRKIGYVIFHFVDGSKLKLPCNKMTNGVLENMKETGVLSCENKAIFINKVLYLEYINVPERYTIRNYFKKKENA